MAGDVTAMRRMLTGNEGKFVNVLQNSSARDRPATYMNTFLTENRACDGIH